MRTGAGEGEHIKFPHHMVHFKHVSKITGYLNGGPRFPHHMVHFKLEKSGKIEENRETFPHHMVHFKQRAACWAWARARRFHTTWYILNASCTAQ